ncbi:MAG: hypothetical protein IIW48_08070 [Clostridia bacterium]|nr:hypothetical protein [Clostridia bacterium]
MTIVKDYFSRIKSNAKTWEIIWWWIFRCVMIFGIVDSLVGITPLGGNSLQVKQMCANLVGMFAWEICMAMSKKNFMRYLPSYIQDFSVLGFFMASFGGAYLNLYYSFQFYDLIFHIFGGAAGALFGYEALVAMQHRDKVKSHVPFVILAAFGMSFICGNVWEIVEFVLDQFFGSDAQHWCREEANLVAERYGNEFLANPHIINHIAPVMGEGWTAETYEIRWALMDTMEDLICNTIGGAIVYVALLVFPYHHKGKNNVNNLYSDIVTEKKSAKKEKVTK